MSFQQPPASTEMTPREGRGRGREHGGSGVSETEVWPRGCSERSWLHLPMPKDLGAPQGGVDPWGEG